METVSYFFRYLPPILLSFLSVVVLSVFNCYIYKFIPINRSVETIEVLAYSVMKAGPIAYALCFIFFFYGWIVLKEDYFFAKAVFSGSVILIIVGFLLNIAFLSKL